MNIFPDSSCDIDMPSQEKSLDPYLEKDLSDEELARYLLADKTLLKYWRILDVRQRSDTSSCCFTKAYTHYAEGTGSVLQHDSHQPFHQKFAEFKEDEDIAHLKPLKLRLFKIRI